MNQYKPALFLRLSKDGKYILIRVAKNVSLEEGETAICELSELRDMTHKRRDWVKAGIREDTERQEELG